MGNGAIIDFRNPLIPYKGDKITWLEITSREILKQTANIDIEGGLKLGEDGPTWRYLLPDQIQETVNNSWEPWETISSRLAGLKEAYFNVKNEAVNTLQGLIDSYKENGIKPQMIKSFGKKLSGVERANFKIDTPLVYKDTSRREWNMEFKLYATSEYDLDDMVDGVDVMKRCSMPVLLEGGSGSDIDLPYAFKLLTITDDTGGDTGTIIKSNWCALTSFQPTYKSPYNDKGKPMIIDLSLTFTELSPLYAESHEYGWWKDIGLGF